jgi:hypothetical protein
MRTVSKSEGHGHTRIILIDDKGIRERTNRSGTWHTAQIRSWTSGTVAFDASHHAWIASPGDQSIDVLTDASGSWRSSRVPTLHGILGDVAIAVRFGAVHLAYSGPSMHLHYLSNASGVWVETTVDGKERSLPSIAVDSTGHALILYATGGGDSTYELALAHGSPSAPTFSHRNVGRRDVMPDSHQPFIPIDGHDRTHIAWVEHYGCGVGPCQADPDAGIWYQRSTGSRWTAPVRASHDLEMSGRVLAGHARAVIATDRVRVTRERSDGTFRSTIVYDPHYQHASVIDLGPGGTAWVVVADTLPVPGTGRTREDLLLTHER